MMYEGFSGGSHPSDPCGDYELIDDVLYDMLISGILGSSENFLIYLRKARLETFLG